MIFIDLFPMDKTSSHTKSSIINNFGYEEVHEHAVSPRTISSG